ncbi:hypothetical protein Rhe02_09650 [Rhizocola hellebori]|uniref:Uncharacterized protein n=1 Tax=Rhizocola hellebori TaxID=1392758 RepID=A0A8J3Q2V2_9ACTN|nr:hypothetical protein [Rhizocola hellebori]GIH02898.1 hypothetical protein Rhe02_09650 [Rhizocola hellebori]
MAILTALSAIDHAFAQLTTERPTPMFFDAGTVPGLPDRPMSLQELSDLLRGRVYVEVTDAVWRQLAGHARQWGGEWVTAAAGIAAPSLTKMASRLGRKHPQQIEDIDSEVLAGFLDALTHAPLEPPQMWLRLCWAAWRGGLRAVPQEEMLELSWDVPSGSRLPRRPYGHPDLLLGRACRAGVITPDAAELIGATRYGGELIDVLAAQKDITPAALRKRRRAAELRLASVLRTGDLSGPAHTPKANTSQRTTRPETSQLRLTGNL